jgi:hypothetical protein
MRTLKILLSALVAVATLTAMSSVALAGGPSTKQNGSNPVAVTFTSICAVSGYANYGECNGDVTKFTDVTSKVNAIQAKQGRYNLGLSFGGLEAATSYTLFGQSGSFFVIGTAVSDLTGHVSFSYQTTNPTGLAFDLNKNFSTTVVTTYWSNQPLGVIDGLGSLGVVVVPVDAFDCPAGTSSTAVYTWNGASWVLASGSSVSMDAGDNTGEYWSSTVPVKLIQQKGSDDTVVSVDIPDDSLAGLLNRNSFPVPTDGSQRPTMAAVNFCS